MKSKVDILQDAILKLLRKGYIRNLSHLLKKVHPVDIALVISRIDNEERKQIIDLIKDVEIISEIISNLSSKEVVVEVLHDMPYEKICDIFHELDSDDAADILGLLPEEDREAILQLIKKEDREELDKLLEYDPNTAGGIMDPQYLAVQSTILVDEALKQIRGSKDIDMVFYIYVVNETNHLQGVLSLRQLVMAPKKTKVSDIMKQDIIYVKTDTDQEEVAKLVSRYDYLALPVVNEQGLLVGMITVDDVIDVIKEEATEDMMKMAGSSSIIDLNNISTFEYIKARSPWLLACFVGGLISARIVSHFEEAIATVLVLAAFMPVVNSMAGNIGSQSASIIVRSIALGKIDASNIWKVIYKELRVGLSLGLLYGGLLAIAVYFLHGEITYLPLVVSISMISAMLVAASIGAIFPLSFDKFGIDPALASGPFVTTVMDIIAVSIYFTVATQMLSLNV